MLLYGTQLREYVAIAFASPHSKLASESSGETDDEEKACVAEKADNVADFYRNLAEYISSEQLPVFLTFDCSARWVN